MPCPNAFSTASSDSWAWTDSSSCFCSNGSDSKIEKIIHWGTEILFAAEIVFHGLDGCMSEQELNLLQLATAVVTQFRAVATEVMRGNVVQVTLGGSGLAAVFCARRKPADSGICGLKRRSGFD